MALTEDEQAVAMETVSDAIMSALASSGHQDDIVLIMGGLGAVVGSMAKASGRPAEALRVMNRIAEGIISGELLD